MTSKGINPDYTLPIYIWELGTRSVSQGLTDTEHGKIPFEIIWVIFLKKTSIHFLVGSFAMVPLCLPFQSNYQTILISNNIKELVIIVDSVLIFFLTKWSFIFCRYNEYSLAVSLLIFMV